MQKYYVQQNSLLDNEEEIKIFSEKQAAGVSQTWPLL